ncbi:D-serine dehydratase-like protein [Hapsidospora chrysogenum ATCC 11550]|uniref:D-serine dehydratase-like protein n=1 Tax=Hapsidospora chrysogenum (strain ATCC 11550 / CBS 779.69 / DSM 880 / IAM 14645 / JCM 23072 / IMI 49137) TaxID=857340 RepID=A0A086T630_HAPC1|nr:D-serine dehydratase-like protein [Hapsidospora chrysogenum ATCC 11550]
MDHALQHHKSYMGRLASELPGLRRNIDNLHQDVEKLGIGFRTHVKTLKVHFSFAPPGRQRGNADALTHVAVSGGYADDAGGWQIPIHRRIDTARGQGRVAARRGGKMLEEVTIASALYGGDCLQYHACTCYKQAVSLRPARLPGILPQLTELRKAIRVQLLIDNEQQLAILERSNPERPLIRAAEACPAVLVYGIYCHANHSYGGRTRAEAEGTLRLELDSVVGAAKLLPGDREIVASVGATPKAHVVESLKAQVPPNVELELHAGLVSETDPTGYVAAEVCGVYLERNDALVNAGVTALSRETSSAYPGFREVVGRPGWGEHEILGLTTRRSDAEESQQQQ